MTTEPKTLPGSEPAAANAIADHLDHFFRTFFAEDDSLQTPECFCCITGEPHPLGNIALLARTASPQDVTRGITPLREGAFPSAVVFLDAGTPEQLAAATDLGFVHAESMPLMSVTRETLTETTLPDGYEFCEVMEDESDAWTEALSEGYGLPIPVGALLGMDRAAARCPGQARYFAAKHEGRMVATSALYLHDGLAGIYAVATLQDHRGKGLGAHMTAAPLRAAWDLGYTTGLLQASEMGAPVYARIGFRSHGDLPLLVHMPE